MGARKSIDDVYGAGAPRPGIRKQRMAAGTAPPDVAPLFMTDAELALWLMGDRASGFKGMVALLERQGLPKFDPLFGGRYMPAVRAWLDERAGLLGGPAPAIDGRENFSWLKAKQKRPASGGSRGEAAGATPIGSRPQRRLEPGSI